MLKNGQGRYQGREAVQNANKSRVGSQRGQWRSPITVEKHSVEEGRKDNKE
jgi:hypothetical protein